MIKSILDDNNYDRLYALIVNSSYLSSKNRLGTENKPSSVFNAISNGKKEEH